MINDLTKKILNKEMDRRQFLQSLGILLIGLVGINSIISALAKPGEAFNKPHASTGRRFNSGKYGVR